jgi:hypothetical protein
MKRDGVKNQKVAMTKWGAILPEKQTKESPSSYSRRTLL